MPSTIRLASSRASCISRPSACRTPFLISIHNIRHRSGDSSSSSRRRSSQESKADRDLSKPIYFRRTSGSASPLTVSKEHGSHFQQDTTAANSNPSRSGRDNARAQALGELIQRRLRAVSERLKDSERVKGWGITDEESWTKWNTSFSTLVEEACMMSPTDPSTGPSGVNADMRSKLFKKLRQAFIDRDVQGLDAELRYAFASHVMSSHFTPDELKTHVELADLSYPSEWYPATRAIQRVIHLHVGPTNSGKTYQALKRLEQAKTGIYAGPLRLLAHEVYTRMNASGRSCALVTGEERRYPSGDPLDPMTREWMSACTVEMVPLNRDMDVAVIDEIQMMSDPDRGWAFTQAFLGIKAKELHCCGEERTVKWIEDMCKFMGEKLVIHRYERLSPLKAMKDSLNGDLTKLQKGDCVIVFSRVGIHAMKKDIERRTGKRCAVVYGSLPPETRAQQARLFNDPDNDFDFLVASDAVGMGLNLSIKRIIFESTSKNNGQTFQTMETPQIKQIAGRAGRYAVAPQKTDSAKATAIAVDPRTGKVIPPRATTVGLVTALDHYDLQIIQKAMTENVSPMTTAGIFPPASLLNRFASYFPPQTPFSYILARLHEISKIGGRFHLCQLKDQLDIADIIQPFDLSVADKITFVAAPVATRDREMPKICMTFARLLAEQSGGHLLDIPELHLELIERPASGDKDYLARLETLHKALTLYLWLSYRFAGVYVSQALGFHVKGLVEQKIDECLAFVELSEKDVTKRAARRRNLAQKASERRKLFEDKDGEEGDGKGSSQGVALPLGWGAGGGEEPMSEQGVGPR